MRLIDGDALITKQASISKTFARSDAQKSLMGRVMYNTEKAPTIAAIPVEWLVNLKNEYAREGREQAEGDLMNLLMMWQKKQEAQDG